MGPIGRWGFGASADLYQTPEGLVWLAGPLIQRNDDMGAWSFAVRSGEATELFIGRGVAFGGPGRTAGHLAPD